MIRYVDAMRSLRMQRVFLSLCEDLTVTFHHRPIYEPTILLSQLPEQKVLYRSDTKAPLIVWQLPTAFAPAFEIGPASMDTHGISRSER